MDKKEWFESWFDTSYYHSLYKNRNDEEAKLFINKLVRLLNLKPKTIALDLACGKGRHSITLNELGMNVLGVDLSSNSIDYAKKHENEFLKFEVHDMRQEIKNVQFDVVFNLFTSFGYFDDMSDNKKVLSSISQMLVEKGTLILDFMNSVKIIENLVAIEKKIEDEIQFNIKREFDGKHIFKHIQFETNEQSFEFTERVQALKIQDFQSLLNDADFQIIHTFGDFNLNPFDEKSSDRLILIAIKK